MAKSTGQFIAAAREVHGDQFDYSQVRYVNALTHIRIGCPSHGWQLQLPTVHLEGTGCPRCRYERAARTRTRSWESVLNDFRRRHGERYDYRLAEYVNVSRKITIICPQHGPFRQRPYCHANGQGCPQCRSDRLSCSQRQSLSTILERFRSVHGDRYDYGNVTAVRNCNCKVQILCRVHGPFQQRVVSHLKGRGCPACRESLGERRVAGVLQELGFQFVRQKRFDSCRDLKPLPFDFFVPAENTLIEYDGSQHFVESRRFDLATIQRHDLIKNEWATGHALSLIRIRYDDYHRIPDILRNQFSKC